MVRTRYFIDISAVPEVGETVTGIARVILAFIWYIARAHEETIDLYGISFRAQDCGYRVWALGSAATDTDGIVSAIGRIRLAEPAVIEWTSRDIVFLLGEQWLFDTCVSEVTKLKNAKGIKIVSLLHDFVPFFMPELYWDEFPDQYMRCIADLVQLSDHIFVYSESTRRDLLRLFPRVPLSQIPVATIRLGDDFDVMGKRLDPKKISSLVDTRFILVVGTIQPRKNHSILLPVWRRLLLEDPARCPMLILAGKRGWHVDDFLYFCDRNPSLREKICVLEKVSDEELRWLYENALFSIYPSLYEGWGLPIAESLSAGRLCLASNTSAMSEIAEDLIDYFSPYDSGELFHLVVQYLNDPGLLLEKERSIRTRFRRTSWSQTVEQILRALHDGLMPEII